MNGMNAIYWEVKLEWDIKDIKDMNFTNYLKIIIKTVTNALIKHEGITDGDLATAMDYGEYLLYNGVIDNKNYKLKLKEADAFANESIL